MNEKDLFENAPDNATHFVMCESGYLSSGFYKSQGVKMFSLTMDGETKDYEFRLDDYDESKVIVVERG